MLNRIWEALLARRVRQALALSEKALKDEDLNTDEPDDDEEWDNEFLAPAHAQALYEHFDYSLHVLGPVIAADPSNASTLAYNLIGYGLTVFVEDENDEYTGALLEMARLVYSHLPADYDVENLPATVRAGEGDSVGQNRAAKVAAFIDAVLSEDLGSAIRVFNAHLADYEDEEECFAHFVGLLTLLLINVAWVYALARFNPQDM